MEAEKKYVAGWFFWLLGIFAVGGIITTILNYAGLIGNTVVERVVFENSFQYTEARKTEIATYEAQLAELSRKLLDPKLDAAIRANLEAQASSINVLLSVARSSK